MQISEARARLVTPAVLLVVLFAFYMATRPAGIHVSDSYAYTNTVEENAFAYFFHPHHALYVSMAWRWTALVRIIFPGASAWAAMSALSAVFGCAGVAALWATLVALGAKRAVAAVLSLVMAVLFGYWFFSSEPEVYVVSLACGLWSMYFLARICLGGGARNAWWAGVCAGFAAAFHQTGIFLFVPACVVVLAHWRARRAAIIRLFLFALAFSVIVVPAYIGAFIASGAPISAKAFLRWLFLFGAEGYGGLEAVSPLKAAVGFGRSIVGGQAILDSLRSSSAPSALAIAGAAAGAGGVAILALLVLRALKRWRRSSGAARTVCVAGAAGFVVYGAFSIYFDPSNFEWWTIPAGLLWLSLAVILAEESRGTLVPALAAALLVAAANLSLDFIHRKDPRNDVVASAAADIARLTDDCDVVVTPSFLGSVRWYHNRDLTVFCPDKASRVYGPAGSQRMLRQLVERAATRNGRIVLAGLESDEKTRRWVESNLQPVPDSYQDIGSIVFFDGTGGIIKRVARLPVCALTAEDVLAAWPNRRDPLTEVALCR